MQRTRKYDPETAKIKALKTNPELMQMTESVADNNKTIITTAFYGEPGWLSWLTLTLVMSSSPTSFKKKN